MQYDEDNFLEYDDENEETDDYDDTFATLACEDCDYRWKVPVDFEDDTSDFEDSICPMCGSSNVVEI